jgi:hypothetical protein
MGLSKIDEETVCGRLCKRFMSTRGEPGRRLEVLVWFRPLTLVLRRGSEGLFSGGELQKKMNGYSPFSKGQILKCSVSFFYLFSTPSDQRQESVRFSHAYTTASD